MKVGILGSGIVAQTLASGFISHQYEVSLGTSHPEKLTEWSKKNQKVKISTFKESASFGDFLVLAVKGTKALEILNSISEEIKGKTIIDTTNPIADSPPENGVLKFFTSLDNSLMEQLQKAHPDSHFVKAFNSVGNAFMVNPQFKTKPTMFICGNNDNSKTQIKTILEKFGFDVEDMGKMESARAIEPLCMLWCIPGFLRNEWSHAFKLLKS